VGKIAKIPESEIIKEIERDGLKVKIEVYKADQKGGGWILEIVDEGWNSTVWDSQFPSSEEAMDAGITAIDEEGIQSFIVDSMA
jgi:hypothetical protein